MKKIKILIGCILFKEFTGSEMYVYELAKGLLNLNYDVSVVSPNIGGRLTDLAIKHGIKVYTFNTLNKNENFDLIHCQHFPITQELIKIFPITKKICTIHSEVNSTENPIQHFSIFKYIAIRPEIKEHLINKFGILSDMIEVIYNPIDETRFNTNDIKNDGYLLFVGTLDYLRAQTIFDLINYTKENNKEFWLVGKNHSNYLPQILSNSHVKYFDSTADVEKFVKNCDVTAGILLGRTTIEGWMCGKPGWIYDVNDKGQILGKKIYSPPSDVDKFYVSNVVNKINNEYKKILNL
jgi:glycosyltransferase involved in cell wall biosynthesis